MEAIKQACPEDHNFCQSSYENKSWLFYGDHLIYSEEGPQQGDPMGPLMFSLAIHPILETMKSSLVIGYLDDLTAGGEQQAVVSDYLTLQRMACEMGLKLNVAKCEVITSDPLSLNRSFGGFNVLSPCEGTLLGAPLLDGSAMNQALESRCSNLCRALTGSLSSVLMTV